MTQKAVIVQELRSAKQGHVRWVRYASALIEGMDMLKEHVPVLGTDCKFGKWYYGPGQGLKSLPSYQKIEQPHLDLHDTYMQIFKLLFKNEDDAKAGFFAKLLGRKKNQEADLNTARSLFKELEHTSTIILAHLERLETEVLALEEEDVTRLYYVSA
ncbi:CZB domain-containing protein [Marinobacter daepoensis]|uniref:CZB domain-containing protein n=1 Tax=Marinobacter daepoensis TaxID=262077 RepID=UPI0003F94BBB|nr:CZB domain-containing protein [Marinobacter daepoensis]